MSKKTVYSHCHYCLSLCGTKITVEGNKVLNIEPDRENPMSWKDFCRKGMTANELIEHPNRIKTPMKRVGDKYVAATYEEAISDIATRLNKIIDRDGVDAVGTYHGNPMGFDFAGTLFFNGLLDALGTGNRYWVGSLDQNNMHVVNEEMYGSELISLPADIDECEFFLLLGMDPVQSKFAWIEVNPNGWNRVLEAQKRGAEVVIVDPRHSESAKRADTYIAIKPGQDWALVLGMLNVIFTEGLERPSSTPLSGVETIKELAMQTDLTELAERCGVDVATITNTARRFAKAPTAMAISHTGVSHTYNGTIGEWLVAVLNAVTNRLDTPGGKRFERSYLDLIKTFSSFAPPSTHKTRLKGNPAIAGFHALSELSDEITTPGKGQIKAMIIASGNPTVSGPDGQVLEKALDGLELLVAVDLLQRTTHKNADWLIPGTHFLEREGLHCLFAGFMDKPFVQYANRAIDPPEGVIPEWQFFLDLTLATKRPVFGKKGANTIIKATKALAKITGKPSLAFNPRWVERLLVASGKSIKYNDIKSHDHGWLFRDKEYGDLAKALRTPDKTVHCSPPTFVEQLKKVLADKSQITSDDFPLVMINKRNRESMNSFLNEKPSLHQMNRSNAVDVHPDDAAKLGLHDGQRVAVRSQTGSIELPVKIVEGGRVGVVVVPHGWGTSIFDPASGKEVSNYGANRNHLVNRHTIDPLSQVPQFNSTAVRIEPAEVIATDKRPFGASSIDNAVLDNGLQVAQV